MARKKTLGQIACEAHAGEKLTWSVGPWEDDWERAAAAVEREVLRRLDGLTIEKELDRRHKARMKKVKGKR